MKTNRVLKAIAFIIAAGAVIFFIPFLLMLFTVLALLFFAVRFFTRSRRHNNYYAHHGHHFRHPFFAQRWQYMSEKDRKAFAQKMERELYTIHITANNTNEL